MRYPIGIQTFKDIRDGGYVYVDKTEKIYSLANGSGKYYFLSRPRRFGKSLLLSTMDAYFSGKKELFNGLAIAELEKDWEEYPVIRIDFTGKKYTVPLDLEEYLDKQLRGMESSYGVGNIFTSADLRFQTVIEAAYAKTGKQVVILIDEYDKPIIDNLDNPELMETFRRILQGFYSVIKSCDQFIRFAFLTGVTKLGKLSVFCGLNNLQDISMDEEFIDICGVSEDELHQYFQEGVVELAQNTGMTVDECYAGLKKRYDGYHFRYASPGIYNPYSLLNALKKKEFRDYWYETGTPGFLVRYLQTGGYNLNDISTNDVSMEILTGTNYQSPAPITLMYQTGYLTIKDYDKVFDSYYLDYPNDEVKNGFLKSLSEFFAPKLRDGQFSSRSFARDVLAGDVDGFMTRFTSFQAGHQFLLADPHS